MRNINLNRSLLTRRKEKKGLEFNTLLFLLEETLHMNSKCRKRRSILKKIYINNKFNHQ